MRYWGDIPGWAYDSTRTLLQALKAVDPETCAHCCRVGDLSRQLAHSAGLNEYEQKLAEFAGLLHDIGKMGIAPHIVHKPGKLDDLEYEKMKQHSLISEEIIRPLSSHGFFQDLKPSVRGHHERLDGRGYPDQLTGDEIPLLSRIILVVDTYDAMSQDRAYRKGLPKEICYAEIERCSGTQFDPQLARIFLEAHKSWKPLSFDGETIELIVSKVA